MAGPSKQKEAFPIVPLPGGVRTEEQAEGTALFTDYDNKYQLAISENWIVLLLSLEDMADILQKMSE